ncbi:MAG: hypothetical protein WCZ28_02320 [Burkholderiaceae bacterium]
MEKDNQPTAFGVFKPVGHVVVSFPPDVPLDRVVSDLRPLGVDMTRYSAREMCEQIDRDLERAGFLANIGQELNLVKAHRALAEEGYNWLVVRAGDNAQAQDIASIVDRHGAERAQYYGRLIVEELLQHGGSSKQRPESPHAGLDSETPSGLEKERALRPPEPPTGRR